MVMMVKQGGKPFKAFRLLAGSKAIFSGIKKEKGED